MPGTNPVIERTRDEILEWIHQNPGKAVAIAYSVIAFAPVAGGAVCCRHRHLARQTP